MNISFEVFVLSVGVAILISAITGLEFGYDDGFSDSESKYQSEAASRGYAEYCAPHGDFAWVGECNE